MNWNRISDLGSKGAVPTAVLFVVGICVLFVFLDEWVPLLTLAVLFCVLALLMALAVGIGWLIDNVRWLRHALYFIKRDRETRDDG